MKKYLIILFILILLFVFWVQIQPKSIDDNQVEFYIERGQGFRQISKNLEESNLIKSSAFFNIYLFITNTQSKLQAGVYLLSPNLSAGEIVRILSSGQVLEKEITIIEGWNIKDIAYYFEKEELFLAEDFLIIVKNDFSSKFPLLKEKPQELDLEGYLFPDTYKIGYRENIEEVVEKMLVNLFRKIDQELIKSQNKTIHEILTMASLIEKEVRTLEDKKIVSGILWKRLEIGMPLQVDATIIYLTGKKDTRVSLEELKIDSLYNTYLNRGLPPGPIANPGLDSILAALYPQESNYLYYLSKPTGETVFSRTLGEHNLAKARYLR